MRNKTLSLAQGTLLDGNTSISQIDEINFNWKDILSHYVPSILFSKREEKVMEHLSEAYEWNNWAEIISFINEYPYLSGFLLEVVDEMKKVFGSQNKIMLKKVTDPELPDETKLFAYICIDMPFDTYKEKFKEFYMGWYIKNIGRARGRFNFDVKWL